MRAFLLAYRAGEIESTVMDRISRALTDAEIEALARHFGKHRRVADGTVSAGNGIDDAGRAAPLAPRLS